MMPPMAPPGMMPPPDMMGGMAPGMGPMMPPELMGMMPPGMPPVPPPPPMPILSPDKIVELVTKMEQERGLLHTRMDQDYSRWRLDPYVGEDALDGFAKFTSNDARTFANWAVSLLTTAKRTVRVYQGNAQRQQRQTNNMKEMFLLGVLGAVDERRGNLGQPKLLESLGWQVCLRGRWAQRVLLVKENDPNPPPMDPAMMGMAGGSMNGPAPGGAPPVDPMSAMALEGGAPPEMGGAMGMPPELMQLMAMMPRTRTYVDVTDWDPRNTYWMMGQHGLAWACHKQKKTRDEILLEFNVDPSISDPMALVSGENLTGETNQRDYWIYEFFDEKVGAVILEDKSVLKPPTPHGMARVPVTLGMVGALPVNLQANGAVSEEDYGESIYSSSRDIYDENNFMLSVMKELSQRAIKQPLVWMTRDGTKLPDEDPRLTGTDVPLMLGEDVKVLPPMEMVKETGAYLGLISAMEQRGSVTHAAFGNLQFQLSGYAINSLRQGVEIAVRPPLNAMVTALKQTCDLLCDSYATGMFDTMTLSGQLQGSRRRYFQETITADMVAQGGVLDVDLVPVLPQDDASKVTVAQMLREAPNGVPLADDRYIREEVMDIQNVDLMEHAVLEQQAGVASPQALAFKMMMAAAEQGDMELAMLWFTEFQMQQMQKMMEMGQMQMMGAEMGMGGPGMTAPGASGPNGGRGRRPASGVLPGPAQGIPPTQPTPQQGPLAPPGTPRPSRQGQRDIPPVVQAWNQ